MRKVLVAIAEFQWVDRCPDSLGHWHNSAPRLDHLKTFCQLLSVIPFSGARSKSFTTLTTKCDPLKKFVTRWINRAWHLHIVKEWIRYLTSVRWPKLSQFIWMTFLSDLVITAVSVLMLSCFLFTKTDIISMLASISIQISHFFSSSFFFFFWVNLTYGI